MSSSKAQKAIELFTQKLADLSAAAPAHPAEPSDFEDWGKRVAKVVVRPRLSNSPVKI
jgi:hypothetical protein